MLINVQSHQAWRIQLTSTTEISPWGAHCVEGKKQHATGQGQHSTLEALPPHRARGRANAAVMRFPNTSCWTTLTSAVVACPAWYIPCMTPYFLYSLCNTDPLLQLLIPSPAHCQAGRCSLVSSVSQHTAIPLPHAAALPHTCPRTQQEMPWFHFYYLCPCSGDRMTWWCH